MNSKITCYLACLVLVLSGVLSANDDFWALCLHTCKSCRGVAGCVPGVSTYETAHTYKSQDEANAACEVLAKNSTSNGGTNATGDTSPGLTPLNFKREGIVFSGVSPDYVKYETVNKTVGTQLVNGVETEVIIKVKKPAQLPTKHSTVFYTDLADGSGYQCAQYLNSQISAPNANGLRTIPAGVQPISITTYREYIKLPENPPLTTLDVIHKQRHPQTGAWVTRTIRKFCPQGNNTWKTEFYLGDPTATNVVPLQTYREIEITRTPNPTNVTEESTPEITRDRDSENNLVITSDVSVTSGFYKYGVPVKLAETQHTGTGSELTTDWTYFTSAADQASFNKPATMRRSDDQWANYTYQGSPVTGILLTKTVSGWLDNAAPAIGTAPDENANRVVVEIEAKNETGTFSREEKIQGVLVSKTWGERYKDNSGMLIEKKRVETGTVTLTTIRTGYPNDVSIPEADRGRVKSIENPDGTVELHSHALQGENLVTTIDKGAGSLSAVTDGTRTVSTYTKHDTLIKEVVSDIASGVVFSTKEAIAFDADDQPTRWAHDNNPDDYTETLNGCCGIDSERSRDGIVTTYTRDGLKRPKTAISQGITLTYTYGSRTLNGTAFPSVNITATAANLSLNKGTTVYDHAGNVIQQISPDLDGDGNEETTAIARDYTARTTTTTHPDDGTIVETDFADGQSKSTTGTATAPSFRQYTTHSEQGGGLVTARGNAATGPWNKTYKNLVGRAFKSTFDNGNVELTLKTNTYDTLGRLVFTEDADNVTTLLAYNTKGEAYRRAIDLNQNGQIDNADRVTDTLQDVIANSSIGNALRSRSVIHDLANNPVTASTTYRTPDGLTARQETLGVANATTTILASLTDRADGNWTDTSTAPDGTKYSVTYQNWLAVTSSRLDTANNVIESTTTGYDALDRPETWTHSRTGLVTTHYATNGRISSIDDHGRVTSFGYDSSGRRIATTLPDNSITHMSYWPTGQEKAVWGSQANPTVKLYTAQGQLHKLRTFRSTNLALAPDESTGNYDETTWTYNTRGLLERKEYADSKGADYTYTDAGRLKTRRWQRGNWTRYDYDTAGSLKATLYFTPATTEATMLAATTGNDPLTPDVIVLNDKLGRQETVTQPNQSQIDYAYDPATLALDSETISYDLDHDGTADFTRVLDRSRDPLGRDKGWQLKDGTTVENEVTYGYNATDGRLQTVADASSGSFRYGYLPNSTLIEKVTATSGAVHTVTNVWETTRNVLDLKQNKVGTTVVSSYDYSVNALGQRDDVTTAFDLGGGLSTNPGFTAWGYDGLGQVVSAAAPGTDADRGYLYDAIGNRRGQQVGATSVPTDAQGGIIPDAGTTAYTANELNQYAGTGVISGALNADPVFDDDGNMTTGPLSGTGGSTANHLKWDAENRLVEVRAADDTTVIVSYAYDAHSRRIARTTGGNTTLFVYDGWNCIAEYSGTTLSKTLTWGPDLSGTMQGAGGVGGLLAVKSGSSVYFPTYDGNGNVSEYLAADGAVAAHFEYDPFGNTVVNTDAGNLFGYRFSTKPQDEATGLYYYGFRYYDPVTGRWPSRDLIAERGGINLYGFVGNNGIGLIDPYGLNKWVTYQSEYGNVDSGEPKTTSEIWGIINGNGVLRHSNEERWEPGEDGKDYLIFGETLQNGEVEVTIGNSGDEDSETDCWCVSATLNHVVESLTIYNGSLANVSERYLGVAAHEANHIQAGFKRLFSITKDKNDEDQPCYATQPEAQSASIDIKDAIKKLVADEMEKEANHDTSGGYGTPANGTNGTWTGPPAW